MTDAADLPAPSGPSSIHLDVESLRTLLAVLDHGGMTRAAAHLHLSQSAVSWKIKRLEQRVGIALLVRDGNTLRPTRATRELLDDARTIVALHDRVAARLAASDLAGSIRLGANEEVDAARMAAVLGRFRRAHPGIHVEFVIDHTEQLEATLLDGGIDVAIIQVSDDGLVATDRVLWTDQLRWLIGREHSFDSDEPLPLVTFGDHCFYRALSEPDLADAGIEHTVAFAAASTSGVRAAIAAGLGVGVLGTMHVDDEVMEWPCAAALPPLPHIHQIVRTSGEHSEVTQTLVDAIATELSTPHARVA